MKYYRNLFLIYFVAHYANEMIFEYFPNIESWDSHSPFYLVMLPIIMSVIFSIFYFIKKFSFKKYLLGLLWSILGLFAANIIAFFQLYIFTKDKSYYFGEQIPWIILFFIIECLSTLFFTSILFPPFYWLAKKIKNKF